MSNKIKGENVVKATTLPPQVVLKKEVNNQKSVATTNKKCASASTTTPQSSAATVPAVNVDNSIRPPPLVAPKLELLLLQQKHSGGAAKKRSLVGAAAPTVATDTAEDIRKKRCSDRYDSSESSDSGVAVLSCTDSSTTSSDSSDPGSPYSPSSVEEPQSNNSSTTQPGNGASTNNMPSVAVGLAPPSLLLTASAPRPLHVKAPSHDQHIIQSSTVSSSCKTDIPALVRGISGATAAPSVIPGNQKLLLHPWTNWSGDQVVLPKLVATSSVATAAINGITKGFSSKSQVGLTPVQHKLISQPPIKKTGNVISPMVSNGGIINALPTVYPVSSSTPITTMSAIGATTASMVKPQSKITGFFKSQMKVQPSALLASNGGGLSVATTICTASSPPPLIKKDLTNLVIRSKEFPKLSQTGGPKKTPNSRKPAGERKPRAGKNAVQAVQGNTIKDIIMKKPVNIAPRLEPTLVPIKPQPQKIPIATNNHSMDVKPVEAPSTVPRITQQPQLVLTAYRLNPEMIANGHSPSPMRIQSNNVMSAPQLVATTATASASTPARVGVQGSPVDNKINTVFQYPLNGSFVSFANLMPHQTLSTSVSQHHQPSAGSNNGGLQNGQTGIDGKTTQQQIFLSQIGPMSKPTPNAQFIVNGTLVKLAGNNTQSGAVVVDNKAGPTPRLVAMATTTGPKRDNAGENNKKSSQPALISTVPSINLTTANKHNHPPPPMFMAMGQGGQLILNTGAPLPPLLATTTTASGGVPPVMPSLQPISLSSLAESHHNHSGKRELPKARVPLSSSPPELVFLQPIAKALASRRIHNAKNESFPAIPAKGNIPALSLITSTEKSADLKKAQLPPLATSNLSEKVFSKVTTEIIQQTLLTTTTVMTKTVSEFTGLSSSKKCEEMTTTSTTTLKERSQGVKIEEHRKEVTNNLKSTESSFSGPVTIADPTTMSLPPPNLTSPKSLVLEKLKLKSESTIKAIHGDLRVEISTDCLDVAKKQLGVLVDQQECAKSPILSQPKTIRFPVRGSEMNGKALRKSGGYVSGNCYWEECNARFENSSKLLDHLQTHHVNGQSGPFRCLWLGCRVNGRESCSRRWLEGHVLSHGGSKTFKCIFEGCGQRFSSQLALQKHVNIHLSSSEKDTAVTNRRSVEGGSGTKYLKRNGKKLRYRRQPWSARMFDFFDTGIMEGLQHRLGVSSQIASDGMLHLRARELARRTLNGATEVYVEWSPANIIEDEWVCLTPGKVSNHIVSLTPLIKSIPIRQLSCAEQIALNKHLRRSYMKPLDVENFLPFDFAMSRAKDDEDEEEKKIKLENVAPLTMEDDMASDSGKGTQRSGSSASVQTTVSSSSLLSSCKSEERKLKRKSKSSSSQSSTITEDSGVAKTAKKHLVTQPQLKLERIPTTKRSIEKLMEQGMKQEQKGKEMGSKKKSQYLKEKKCNLNVQSWKGKRTLAGEKRKIIRKEKS